MDKNEVLANFQACTGIDDIGECMVTLEQHDWNLQSAVTACLAKEHGGSSHTSNGAHFQPIRNGFSPKMLTFSCKLGGLTKDVTLDDSNTVGNLKEIASIELGIPLSETQFERWPPESVVSNPNDNTVLSAMCLPHFNVLNVKTQSQSLPTLPGVSVGLDATDTLPFSFPCPSFKESTDSEMRDLTASFKLQITNTDNNTCNVVEFEGLKTVEELRKESIPLTGIPYKEQEWSGFPGSNLPDSNCTLASLNLDRPIHHLSVKKKNSRNNLNKPHASSALPFNLSSYSIPTRPLFPSSNHSILSSRDANSSSSDEDDSLDDDLIFSTDHNSVLQRQKNMMPDRVEDAREALVQFQQEFHNRYNGGPQFVAQTLQNALQLAFGSEARNRKLLAVYIHHDQSIQSNVFCSQLLCNESITSYLSEHYLCWAWDVTSNYNKQRFLQECSQHMGSGISDTLRRLKTDEYPVLILVQGKGRSCDVTAMIQGNSEINELMAKLIRAVDELQLQKEQDIREEDARKAREQIKLEQEEAYRQSLAADRAKILEEEMAAEKQKEEERQRKAAEEQKQAKVDHLRSIVPSEPAADCGQPISQVRFRTPDGTTIMRSFLASEPLQTLIDFVGSKGFPSTQYRVLKPWPKTNLLDLDMTSSLMTHKIFPQESLIIEELPELDS